MDDILTKLTFSTTSVESITNKEITEMVDETIDELDSLFKELRKYAKEDNLYRFLQFFRRRFHNHRKTLYLPNNKD